MSRRVSVSAAGVGQVYPGLSCDSEVKKLMFGSDVGHKKLESMTQSAQQASPTRVRFACEWSAWMTEIKHLTSQSDAPRRRHRIAL